jgi:hypothetical protein
MKKRFHALALSALLAISVPLSLVGCKNGQVSGSEPTTSLNDEYDGPYSIRLTAIGSTTIHVSKTVLIRSSVTGTTEKDVTWSSSNENVATVDKGTVTGMSEGVATITASLVIDPRCKASIDVTVLGSIVPESLTIKGYTSDIQWVDESLQLSVEADNPDASTLVNWSTSSSAVAAVSETGYVTFLDKGNVTITATSTEAPDVYASVTFQVKKGFFYSDKGSPFWDLSHQADEENPYIYLPDSTPTGYHSLYFKGVKSTRYFASVTFEIKKQLSSWVWQGVGLGSGLSEDSTRYFLFSPVVPGQGNDYQKIIVKTLPNESWPAITTRSQIWGQNGLNDIDASAPITISMVRDGNDYYYLINDKLYYFDNTTDYDGVETYPILCAIDEEVKAYNYMYETDDAAIDAILAQEQYKKSFFASNPNIVYYDSDAEFTFTSMTTLNKDHRVMSLGDKAKVYGDFTVEFDVKSLKYNETHVSTGFTGLTVNFSKYEQADSVNSFMIGRSSVQTENTGTVARYAEWNYQQSMDSPGAVSKYLETSAAVTADALATNHVKITRTIESSRSYFRMWVNDVECDFDVKSYADDELNTRYTNAYIIWVGGEYSSSIVSNFTFTIH